MSLIFPESSGEDLLFFQIVGLFQSSLQCVNATALVRANECQSEVLASKIAPTCKIPSCGIEHYNPKYYS